MYQYRDNEGARRTVDERTRKLFQGNSKPVWRDPDGGNLDYLRRCPALSDVSLGLLKRPLTPAAKDYISADLARVCRALLVAKGVCGPGDDEDES